MKKNSIVFIDKTAWIALLDKTNPNYEAARVYFENLLAQNARLVTNNYCVDETVSFLRSTLGNDLATKFMLIIDESVLSINLRVDWISRRIRRNALNNFLKSSNSELSLNHFFIYESIKRKRVDFIFSYDTNLKNFDFPVMPQNI
ncbi:MAG: PIN domain-containing protein [Calditrichaeota bacterium]|nr:MAG: PIN domain-containing protein [Calditrichota bacterium]MBL1207390.1 PIN domain-containing protein [Calditrichota bacterium]NOG47222.1 type II toxin-antitoxin system VapC family toxin [Calditrichota bacterium]